MFIKITSTTITITIIIKRLPQRISPTDVRARVALQ